MALVYAVRHGKARARVVELEGLLDASEDETRMLADQRMRAQGTILRMREEAKGVEAEFNELVHLCPTASADAVKRRLDRLLSPPDSEAGDDGVSGGADPSVPGSD